MTERDQHDPKGLVREAYAIPGITEPECRSIFLDWALSLPVGMDPQPSVRLLIERHAIEDHPMTSVLKAALATPETPRRKGGRAARIG
jgi:hypothetical protein